MHLSVRRYLGLSVVFEFSMFVGSCIGLVHFNFDPDDPLDLPFLLIGAAASLAMALLTLLLVSLDLLNRRNLSRADVSRIRFKLRREQKSYRYEAQPKHLRGITIGAVFFGVFVLIALCVQGMAVMGVINLPK